VSGFVLWLFKYVDQKHGGVPSEWRMTHVMSAFNIVIDADACSVDNFANAAFYSHYALTQGRQRFVQNSLAFREELIQKGFLNEQNIVSQKTYMLFYAGDSGSGYLNPTQLFEPRQFSGLPPVDDLWLERNRFYFNKFNIKHIGFVINGDSGPLTNNSDLMYTKFSPLGFTR